MTPLLRRALPALLLLVSSVAAQNPELENARRRIEQLRERAEHLQSQGREEAARELAQEARAMEERMRQAVRGRDQGESEKILHGLEMGIESLRALGRHDAREALERIANEVRREGGERREQARGEHPEIRAAREQLAVFRTAQEGFVAGGWEEGAEQMARAVRALETRIEGRRDEEAQAIQRRSPDHQQITELLARAAALLKEQQKPDRAGSVARLAEQFGERYRQKERATAERDQGEVGQQIEQLRRQVKELQRAIEELRRERAR